MRVPWLTGFSGLGHTKPGSTKVGDRVEAGLLDHPLDPVANEADGAAPVVAALPVLDVVLAMM